MLTGVSSACRTPCSSRAFLRASTSGCSWTPGQGVALAADPLAADMAFNSKHARHIIQLLADVFADAFELAPTAALGVLGLVMDQCAGQFCRQGARLGCCLGLASGELGLSSANSALMAAMSVSTSSSSSSP